MVEDFSRERVNEVKIKGQRHYELPNGQLVPSVTTFLNVLPKPALDKWKLKTIATWAVENKSAWTNLPNEAAVDVLQKSLWYDTKARDDGDIAHHILEMRAIGREVDVPPGYEGASRAWDLITEEFEVEVLYAEPQLLNYTLGYAGSADIILRYRRRADGPSGKWKTVVGDWKSGNGLFGSTAYQLMSYAQAEKLLTPDGQEVDMPEIDGTLGIWVRPNGVAIYPMEYSQDVWDVVRCARRLFDLTKNEWNYRGKPINSNPIKSKGPAWGSVE